MGAPGAPRGPQWPLGPRVAPRAPMRIGFRAPPDDPLGTAGPHNWSLEGQGPLEAPRGAPGLLGAPRSRRTPEGL